MNRLIDKLGLTAYRDYPVPLDERQRTPKEVRIPLKQHIGVPAVPTVKEGAEVKQGDLIAAVPEGKVGANVHASVSGRVTEVEAKHICIESD
jgi:Na+-translocating ferredoxin:NAD+ oxidoreductase RnfC subunit